MSSRSTIFANIRKTTEALSEKTPLPQYDVRITHSQSKLEGGSLWEIFSRNLKAVNGKAMESVAQLADFLKSNGRTTGYCDPALMDAVGGKLAAAGLTVETVYDRANFERYEFGITRASGAIAESGTLILDDDRTSHRLAALTPWVHVAVIEEKQIHRAISDALSALGTQTASGGSPNIIWATGPSKTADVEGILIEGVHGPGEQIALML